MWLIGVLICITAYARCVTVSERAYLTCLCVCVCAFQPACCKQLLSRPVQLGWKLWKQCHGLKDPCLIDKPQRERRAFQGPLTQKHWLSSLPTNTQIHVWLELLWQPVPDSWWAIDSLLFSQAWRARCTFSKQMSLRSIQISLCTKSRGKSNGWRIVGSEY